MPSGVDLIVERGRLIPADAAAVDALREMRLAVGEVVHARIVQPRNPRFFRLAHRIAALIQQNVDGFELLTAHQCLKRLQVESGIACDEMQINAPGLGAVTARVPQSLAFDSMNEADFRSFVDGLCAHVAAQYWPGCTADEVERMAEAMQ